MLWCNRFMGHRVKGRDLFVLCKLFYLYFNIIIQTSLFHFLLSQKVKSDFATERKLFYWTCGRGVFFLYKAELSAEINNNENTRLVRKTAGSGLCQVWARLTAPPFQDWYLL